MSAVFIVADDKGGFGGLSTVFDLSALQNRLASGNLALPNNHFFTMRPNLTLTAPG
jgi:hypothetical protein